MLGAKPKRQLKALAHPLKPVVYVGKKGLDGAVGRAVARELLAHELIKVKLLESCGLAKQDAAARLSAGAQAELVHIIGRTIILYKKHPLEPKIVLAE